MASNPCSLTIVRISSYLNIIIEQKSIFLFNFNRPNAQKIKFLLIFASFHKNLPYSDIE